LLKLVPLFRGYTFDDELRTSRQGPRAEKRLLGWEHRKLGLRDLFDRGHASKHKAVGRGFASFAGYCGRQ